TTDGSGNFTGTFTSPTTVTAGQVVTATATNTVTLDTSEFSNTQVVLTPTATKFVAGTAMRSYTSVSLKWRTGMEVDNLGFNVYREENRERVLLTEQPV